MPGQLERLLPWRIGGPREAQRQHRRPRSRDDSHILRQQERDRDSVQPAVTKSKPLNPSVPDRPQTSAATSGQTNPGSAGYRGNAADFAEGEKALPSQPTRQLVATTGKEFISHALEVLAFIDTTGVQRSPRKAVRRPALRCSLNFDEEMDVASIVDDRG